MARNIGIALVAIGLWAASGAAVADKPSWAGGEGRGKGEERAEGHGHKEGRGGGSAYGFDGDSRRIVADYYGAQARGGKCPPGLAKKRNGCQPPGQAKKWQMGQPLPADLRYYDLPHELMKRLPPPPPQHRYVQIAGDILMVAVGTSMVVDAIEDILR